jgi:hypothetical protein
MLPELRNRFWTLVVFLLIIAVTCLTTSAAGLMCSALARRTSTALVLSYMTLLALFVLPIGVTWYLEGVSEDLHITSGTLAVLRITSPYAAATSVPMHTFQGAERWTSSNLEVVAPPSALFPKGVDIPVWACFLVVCPLIGLVFAGVACLVFRWKWWRAGDGL